MEEKSVLLEDLNVKNCILSKFCPSSKLKGVGVIMERNRDKCLTILTEYTKNESLLKHAYSVESCVKEYAEKFKKILNSGEMLLCFMILIMINIHQWMIIRLGVKKS